MARIGILTNSLSAQDGGWARYSAELIRALSLRGHELRVFLEGPRGPATREPDGTEVRSGLSTHAGTTARNVKRILSDYFWLRNQIRDLDIIHSFVEHHSFAASFLDRPYFVTAHGTYGPRYLAHPLYRSLARDAFTGASKVMCVSEFTRRKILEHAPRLKNTLFTPNGVDTKRFTPPENDNARQPFFISVGAVKARKGQDLVVQAFARLQDDFPEARYIVVGNQSDAFYEQLAGLTVELGVAHRVQFLANVADDELIRLYRKCTAFLIPSRTDAIGGFEGMPLAALEAAACGLPIVGTYDCGSEHLIDAGANGFLIDQEDVSALEQAIRFFLERPDDTRRMGRFARARAEELSWDSLADRVDSLYVDSGALMPCSTAI